MQIILKYFPDLTNKQIILFEKMAEVYREWNENINVIPRREMDSLYELHILHSLAIAKIISFKAGTRILDVGTGGGFPGISLAILFPACRFILIDSMKKRIKVVQTVSEVLNLKNVTAINVRVQDINEKFDFVASRAVAAFPVFVNMVKKNISINSQNTLQNGIFYLKSGDFEEELKVFKNCVEVTDLSEYFTEPSFETKKVIYLPVSH